jgi:hypothetical protein
VLNCSYSTSSSSSIQDPFWSEKDCTVSRIKFHLSERGTKCSCSQINSRQTEVCKAATCTTDKQSHFQLPVNTWPLVICARLRCFHAGYQKYCKSYGARAFSSSAPIWTQKEGRILTLQHFGSTPTPTSFCIVGNVTGNKYMFTDDHVTRG